MNINALQKSYGRLSPFERASMVVQECAGRRRQEVLLSLQPVRGKDGERFFFMKYWQERWHGLLVDVCTYAVNKAILAEMNCFMVMADCNWALFKGDAQAAHDALERHNLYRTTAVKWLLALRKLESQTGAPFGDCLKYLDFDWATVLLDDFGTLPDGEYAAEFRKLAGLWNMLVRDVNQQDQGREVTMEIC